MKVLKKILTSIFSIFLFFLIFILSLSLISKNLIQHQIFNNLVKDQIEKKYIEESDNKQEKFEDIFDEKDINEIVNVVLKDFMDSIDNEDYQVSDKTVEMIIDFCLKNKDTLSKLSGSEIKESDINSPESRSELSESLTDAFQSLNDELDDTIKTAIKIYNYFTSSTIIIIMFISILLLTGIIMLVNYSIYNGLNSLGICMIINGIIYAPIYSLLNSLTSNITLNDEKVVISVVYILIVSIISFIFGVLMLVLKRILKKENNKSEQEKMDV